MDISLLFIRQSQIFSLIIDHISVIFYHLNYQNLKFYLNSFDKNISIYISFDQKMTDF